MTVAAMLVVQCLLVALAFANRGTAEPESTQLLVKPSRLYNAGSFRTVKIIGGTEVSIRLRPFMVGISIVAGKTLSTQCGGTIIDNRHILTAAHCVTNKDPRIYRVRVGSDNWASGGLLVSVTNIFVHPKYYKAAAYDYDVAVLKLDRNLVFGPTVQQVNLVKVNTGVATGTSITLVGWGYTDALHSTPLPSKLRQVKVSTIDHSECEGDYSDFDLKVTARMFCGMSLGKDSCQGDSGGPVLNSWTGQQMGVISWSMGCNQIGAPGVFANVADPGVRSFINESQKK